MFDAENLLFGSSYLLEKNLRDLADQINNNREYKTIIELYKVRTKTEPVPCDNCEPGVARIKCKKCYGYGYVLKSTETKEEIQ